MPEPERALAFLASEGDADSFAGRRVVVGAPDTVRRELEQIAAEYGADELMVLTMTHDEAARRRSYELLAEAFGLEPTPVRDSRAEPTRGLRGNPQAESVAAPMPVPQGGEKDGRCPAGDAPGERGNQ